MFICSTGGVKNCGAASVKFIAKLIPKTTRRGRILTRRGREETAGVDYDEWVGKRGRGI